MKFANDKGMEQLENAGESSQKNTTHWQGSEVLSVKRCVTSFEGLADEICGRFLVSMERYSLF